MSAEAHLPGLSPAVTVVIATRNRRDELVRTLGELRALPERPLILVMDNGSTDGSPAAARAFGPQVSVVELAENSVCAARNVGVRMASTPLVAFSDDDSWWAPGALARAAEVFARHPRLALLAGRILVGPEHRLDPVCAEMADGPLPVEDDLPGRSILGFLACGVVVRRSCYLVAGGFPEHYRVGSEEAPLALELAARGWGLAYVEDVVAHHHPSQSRNRARRRALLLRNDLWFSWSREPAPAALSRTWSAVRASLRDPDLRAGTWEAVRGAPAVLRERRLPPVAVADDLAALRAG